MAAIDFDATGVPTELVTGASLVQGIQYSCMNVSTRATLFLREATTPPAADARAFRVETAGVFTVKPSGVGVYVWTDDPAGCPIILNEAP